MSDKTESESREEPRRNVEERVATGLRGPVRVRATDLEEAIPIKVSDHALERWHLRVMKDRSFRRATVALVELLESGRGVRSRRNPFHWVRGREKNLLYFAIGDNVLLPAETSPEEHFELEIVTCLTNPRCGHPLPTDGRKRKAYRRRRSRRPREEWQEPGGLIV